jgi:hypothetical protein
VRYPCQLIDPHHARCYLPNPLAVQDGLACVPGCPERAVAGAYALDAELGDGDDAYTTISTSEPLSVWAGGGPGDDRIMLRQSPWAAAGGGEGHNVIRVGYNTAPADYTIANPINGGNGPDEIYAANGSYNYIWCGYGVDTVAADEMDFVDPNCDNVERR